MTDIRDSEDLRELLAYIATVSRAFASQAGVGGMETAGMIVSYLAEHPVDLEPFLRGGIFELPEDWHQQGCLTWMTANGNVIHPDYARRARVIRKLEKSA